MMAADDQQPATRPDVAASAPASVLWLDAASAPSTAQQPQCFVDLNLDQIFRDMLEGREAYDLLPVMHIPLTTEQAVRYRQAVMADLESPAVQAPVRAFAKAMQATRDSLVRAEKRYYERQKQRWFLDAVSLYTGGVAALLDDLLRCDLASAALKRFRDVLANYASSRAFIALNSEADRLVEALAAIRYTVRVRGLRVDVAASEGEADYSEAVLRTFERFRQGAAKAYAFDMPNAVDMDHVEASILDEVAKIHPALFEGLAAFHRDQAGFLDPGVQRFDREVQVYLAFIDYVAPLRAAGLPFCTPEIAAPLERIESLGGYDLALARKLVAAKQTPVPNDVVLQEPERIVVVSGPNQGGKTTFARAFGQLHYLGALGLQVPGTHASLRLFDHLFTHFERGENTTDLRGKLEDDLIRVHEMLEASTDRTVIIFNEMFTSTTFRDALVLSRAIMRRLIDRGLTAMWVTFIDELASWNEHTVSMVSTVTLENLSQRTFKIVRRPADGLAYALSIAQKWRVTLPQIRERLSR